MKKLSLVLAVLLGLGIGKVLAGDIRNVPASGNTDSIPADYGGVDVATNSFFIGLATVPSENGAQAYGYRKFYASTTTVQGVFAQTRWTVYGAIWSTGTCPTGGAGGFNGDYVSVQVSSSGASQARELTRIYNNVAIGTGPVCGGIIYLRWPIRAYGNLFWGVDVGLGGGTGGGGNATNANPYNRADLLYYRESE